MVGIGTFPAPLRMIGAAALVGGGALVLAACGRNEEEARAGYADAAQGVEDAAGGDLSAAQARQIARTLPEDDADYAMGSTAGTAYLELSRTLGDPEAARKLAHIPAAWDRSIADVVETAERFDEHIDADITGEPMSDLVHAAYQFRKGQSQADVLDAITPAMSKFDPAFEQAGGDHMAGFSAWNDAVHD